MALGETLIAETCGKGAPDCGDERAAAGQEHTVDIAGIDALPDEEVVDSLLDAGNVVGYPALEIFAREIEFDALAIVGMYDGRPLAAGPTYSKCFPAHQSRSSSNRASRGVLRLRCGPLLRRMPASSRRANQNWCW